MRPKKGPEWMPVVSLPFCRWRPFTHTHTHRRAQDTTKSTRSPKARKAAQAHRAKSREASHPREIPPPKNIRGKRLRVKERKRDSHLCCDALCCVRFGCVGCVVVVVVVIPKQWQGFSRDFDE
mmetsp:Transcript_116018/g.237224  ORF Transcript_116018/g.237224 Transcript_116018/m.237224 type:complete len:123 (+) Transcript_116018:486-854(+)